MMSLYNATTQYHGTTIWSLFFKIISRFICYHNKLRFLTPTLGQNSVNAFIIKKKNHYIRINTT